MANAEIILTENVPNLGAEADIVKVRRGYARNFLIPQNKGLEVTPGSLRQIKHLQAKRAEREARELTAAEELASKINRLELSFTLETGETGKAFGAITAKDIQDRLAQELRGVELPRHAVTLDKAIRESGGHEVAVKLHPDVTARLHVQISSPKSASEEAETEEESSAPRRKAPRKKPASSES